MPGVLDRAVGLDVDHLGLGLRVGRVGEIADVEPAVGREGAVFLALEVKDRGRLTAEQAQFLQVVRESGGIAAEVRCVEDAERTLNGF